MTQHVCIDYRLKLLFLIFLFVKFLAMLGLHCFTSVLGSRGCSPVVVYGLLIAAASLVMEHRLQGAQTSVGAAGA